MLTIAFPTKLESENTTEVSNRNIEVNSSLKVHITMFVDWCPKDVLPELNLKTEVAQLYY